MGHKTSWRRKLLILFIILVVGGGAYLALGGRVPFSIAGYFVSEVEISLDDLALVSVISEKCAENGHDAFRKPIDTAIATLSTSQAAAFDAMAETLRQSPDLITQSGKADECRIFANQQRQLGSLPYKVTGGE